MASSYGEAHLRRPAAETANVIDEDVELADAIAVERRAAAARAARALLLRVGTGSWEAQADAEMTRGGFGFLVLTGLLIRRVGIGERIGAELLGPTDLLRPLEHDGEEATLPFEAAWRVLQPLRLAVLDRRWTFRMSPFPEIAVELTSRATRRSRRLANTLAISHHPRLDERLLLLLWELADRYGTVRREGIHVPVPMTHEVLSHLAGARRPSVSGALGRLSESGMLERTEQGWLLRGEPPAAAPLPPAGDHEGPAEEASTLV
jgi:CRP/FNR family transcriptional regulator, cyclic AMP receptor protein